MPGRVLNNRYEVQDKVGTGGMAVVYRGIDRVLDRTVAIKMMLPQYANDQSFAARFKQEAQAAAALQSPYIVSIYDWLFDSDSYYIVMEYLRGTDLKSGIRKHGALDCKKVAQIGSQIAQALAVAHRHDIIHRDIKPQNIMVQPDGNIKVMDFGIARPKNSHLTQDNSVLGTAHYVSPEQTQGKELGPTTDIYSLGIVMYEAVTGSVPFDGDDAISVALKQVNEQPQPPSQRNPAVDPSLEAIILKCMQKNPADRFQTADELKNVLNDYLAGRLQSVSRATSVLPVNHTPQIGAPATATTTQVATPATATMPRVPVTSRPIQTHGRQTTATELARQQTEEAERKHHRNVAIGAIFGILAAIGLFIAGYNLFNSANTGTQAVPNLASYTEQEAIAAIEATDGWFEVGDVVEEYSDTVEEGYVIDQDPEAGVQRSEGTRINLYISKGPEPAADVKVPDLSNMTAQQAEAALAEVNLVSKAGEGVYDPDVEVGHVVSQTPAAGTTVKAGDTVTYQLSLGAESTDVPDVTNYSESDAWDTLTDAGFVVNVRRESSETVSEGYVIRQSPTGTAEKGATIVITISSGSASVSAPNVVGNSQSAAEAALTEAGFSVNVETASSNSVVQGYVISQSPSGGTTVTKGSTITITVSTGPASSSSSTGESETDSST